MTYCLALCLVAGSVSGSGSGSDGSEAGVDIGATQPAEQSQVTLRILSFNMRQWTRDMDSSQPTFWRNRMEAMSRMIEDVDPDVICFQEFMVPVGQYVPDEYRRVGVTVSHPIYVRRGLEAGGHRAGVFWDVCVVRGIRVINVHSRWESDILLRTVTQVNGLLGGRDVACGDWNNSLAPIERAGLKMKSARGLLGISEKEETFVNFTRPQESHGTIDHFFVNGVTPLNYNMITANYGLPDGVWMSDHRPIVLDCR